jgi:hypothetical protein
MLTPYMLITQFLTWMNNFNFYPQARMKTLTSSPAELTGLLVCGAY